MPLIPCPECNKQVSEQAPSCPYCGHPIDAAPHKPVPPRVVIQQPQQPQSSAAGKGFGTGFGCVFGVVLALIIILIVLWVGFNKVVMVCPTCGGTGNCKLCGGTGKGIVFGDCMLCGGKKKCNDCGGSGFKMR